MIVLLSITTLLLTAVYLLLVAYVIKGWHSLKTPRIDRAAYSTKVTVMIAARNEEENIRSTIEDLLAQDYPKELTEIIIVDDHSTDTTPDIIASYADRGIRLIRLNESKILNSYKKKAISEAIGQSKGDLMIATDADCRMGKSWISAVVGYFENDDLYMISSPVTYFEEQSTFERMQTLEFSFLIGIGAAFIGNNRASTCNGANLAYRKDIFYEVGGFTGIDELASGDDELLLQKVAARFPGKIGFLKRTEAIVYTHAKPNLKEFLQQRRRWASKSTKYKDKKIVAFAVTIWLYNVSILVNAALSFFDVNFFRLLIIQLALKYLFEIVLMLPIAKFFKRTKLMVLIVLVIPLHVLYMVYIGLVGNNRKYAWKGRMVR